MRLPLWAEVKVGASVDLHLTFRDANGEAVSNPTYTAVSQPQGEHVTPAALVKVGTVARFSAEAPGTYVVKLQSTDPIQAVEEGVIRVVPSEIVSP